MSANGHPAMNSMSTNEKTENDVVKVYKYIRNGKKQVVKREYKIKGERKAKLEELTKYLDEFKPTDSVYIKDYYKKYNEQATLPISYSMFYKIYVNYPQNTKFK